MNYFALPAAVSAKVVFTQLGEGFVSTIVIFVLTLSLSIPLGFLISFCRRSRFAPLRLVTKLYISVMRGTPLMLQLMVVMYAPAYLFEWRLGTGYRFWAVIIGFVVNYAAYFAEIFRGGIESIPKGQYEAAQVLGYSSGQTFFRIVLPQVIKIIMPSVTNEVITLVKDTSLAFVISYAEMFTAAKRLAALYSSLLPYFGAGIFYYVFNFVVAWIMERVEKRMSYYKA